MQEEERRGGGADESVLGARRTRGHGTTPVTRVLHSLSTQF